jgi:hypothetical protein
MKANNIFIVSSIILLGAFFCSCQKEKTGSSALTSADITGTWIEVIPTNCACFAEERLEVTFDCKSKIFLRINHVTDAISVSDSCYSKGSYSEYVKGDFTLQQGVILLSGIYVDSLQQTKTDGCYTKGDFNRKFSCQLNKDTLMLNPTGECCISKHMLVKKKIVECN